MYSQTLFGPRCILPKTFRQTGYDFYKDKNDILLLKPDADNVNYIIIQIECNICLYGLFNIESSKYNNLNEDFPFEKSPDDTTSRILMKRLKEIIFDFHEYNFILNKKPFMLTPCKHLFHTQCLESWFKQKKECPNCRQEIPDIGQ